MASFLWNRLANGDNLLPARKPPRSDQSPLFRLDEHTYRLSVAAKKRGPKWQAERGQQRGYAMDQKPRLLGLGSVPVAVRQLEASVALSGGDLMISEFWRSVKKNLAILSPRIGRGGF
jgi:hypothetical protein